MMNIACDARALVGPATGVGTWTRQTMGGLADSGKHRILLAASRSFVPPRRLQRDNVTVLPNSPLPLPGTLWLHARLPRLLELARADVMVASLAIVPRRCPVPAVAVVHDLTPRSHPQRHTLANRFCFNAYLEESLLEAQAVVAVSCATARVLEETYGRLADKVQVISNGVDPFFCPAEAVDDGAAVRELYCGGRPYLLHLGTLEPRKGLIGLIEAWERLHQRLSEPPDLVLAGREGWGTGTLLDRIARSPYHARIHRPGYVSRDEARELLRHAAVFVLASEAEGFGLPLAEALSCGAACVASDIAPLREVAGDAALFAPPGDAAALADAIVSALAPGTSQSLSAAALRRAPESSLGQVNPSLGGAARAGRC